MWLYNYGNSGFSRYDCTKTGLSRETAWLCVYLFQVIWSHVNKVDALRVQEPLVSQIQPSCARKETRHEASLFSINGESCNRRIRPLRIEGGGYFDFFYLWMYCRFSLTFSCYRLDTLAYSALLSEISVFLMDTYPAVCHCSMKEWLLLSLLGSRQINKSSPSYQPV